MKNKTVIQHVEDDIGDHEHQDGAAALVSGGICGAQWGCEYTAPSGGVCAGEAPWSNWTRP